MAKLTDQEIKRRAIELAGGRQALADALGITPQAITQWPRIPAERLGDVSRATKHQMTPQQLRPDIFAGLPTQAA